MPVESLEDIILKNPPKSPFKKGGLSVDSKDFPPFVKGGVRGAFAFAHGGLDSGYPPLADSGMTGSSFFCHNKIPSPPSGGRGLRT